MGCIHATDDQMERLLAAIEADKHQRAEEMPDERAALKVLMQAYERLGELGWRNAIYCPKDGSEFLVIEAGSTGVHRCIYQGEWPKGCWWIVEDGDMSPSRPILFKPLPASVQADENIDRR